MTTPITADTKLYASTVGIATPTNLSPYTVTMDISTTAETEQTLSSAAIMPPTTDTTTVVGVSTTTKQTFEEQDTTTGVRVSPTNKQTFEELIEDLRIKKKPVYKPLEAPAGKAIGTGAIIITTVILTGIILLDISTIRAHVKIFYSNVTGIYKRRQSQAVSCTD
jgi:hypothetical protein